MTLLIILVTSVNAYARVYVYEVTTAEKRFQVVSKLAPDAYLMYNGGNDVIRKLVIIAVYKDNELDKAMKDYNLEKNNNNSLPFEPVPDERPRTPDFWWR